MTSLEDIKNRPLRIGDVIQRDGKELILYKVGTKSFHPRTSTVEFWFAEFDRNKKKISVKKDCKYYFQMYSEGWNKMKVTDWVDITSYELIGTRLTNFINRLVFN